MLLSVYRVLDLCDDKGMFAGKILADMGADVIKVEKPGGDPVRKRGPFYKDIPDPEKSLFWFANNNGKRGVTLDITAPKGRDLFKKLVKTADVLLESFPVGYLKDIGLGYEDLSAMNDQLVMASISPFGQTGPYSRFKGDDLIVSAMGGLMQVCGDEDRRSIARRFSAGLSRGKLGRCRSGAGGFMGSSSTRKGTACRCLRSRGSDF